MANSKNAYPDEFIYKTEELEEKICHKFTDKTVLYKALTHSSYSNECRAKGIQAECNERLEFLGDSVLSLVVSKKIFSEYKSGDEGDLTKMRAHAVCEDALYEFAKKINLGDYLLLGKGEEKSHGRERKSILADATEALLAAFFIDSGYDTEAVFDYVMKIAIPRIEEYIGEMKRGTTTNYKGALQQFIQNSKGDVLEYRDVYEKGPDHAKVFGVNVMLNSNVIGKGEGRTKQEAEQQAAKAALQLFGENV